MFTLEIPNISCGHCVRAITEAVKELDAGAVVQVDVATRSAAIETRADLASVCAKLAAEGYPASAA